MGYLVTVKQGGHVPRSTRNVPGSRGPWAALGLRLRDGVGEGVSSSPG